MWARSFCWATILALPSCVNTERSHPIDRITRPDAATIERFSTADDRRGVPVVAVVGAVDEESSNAAPSVDVDPKTGLGFDEVMRSVEGQFPLILSALEEVQIARARLLSAEGGFDVAIKGDSENSPQGFYETETAKLRVEQPTTFWGATVFTGYKIGSGDFPVWEGGRRTRTHGELSAGLSIPLLKGRTIDPRRLALWKARLGEAQADPIVIEKRLDATRKAALTYWKWVAAGQKLGIAKRLLDLALTRQQGIEISVEEGALAPLSIVENKRLMVERRSIVIRAERALEQAAIALSLFWRDRQGAPLIPNASQLPPSLPEPRNPEATIREEDFDIALSSRPEIRALELDLLQLEFEGEKAENDLLPKLDLTVAGSKDLGSRTTDPDDKGPFEFDILLNFDLPVQRRNAKGKILALDAKSVQLERKLQFARESVIAEVRDAQSALRQTWRRLAQVRENAALAGQLEEAERVFLSEGQSDLLRVNLREQQTASAASTLIDVVSEHFQSLSEYRASLGIPYDESVPGRSAAKDR